VDNAELTAREQDRPYRVALGCIGGLSVRVLRQGLTALGSAECLWKASPAALAAALGESVAARLAAVRSKLDPQRLYHQALERGYELLLFGDGAYPHRLAESPSPPAVLHLRGRSELLESPSVSIVGTRQPTPYGLRVAREFAGGLARDGFAIVSGLARGIDCAAHASALEVGGATVAVLGCGADICYPPEARELKQLLERDGLVVSPFPLGQKPLPALFPARNRVISALGHACLLVEAGIPSGALITAEVAQQLQRPLFVVPGNIFRPETAGGHHLLVEGTARVAASPDDVVAGLSRLYGVPWIPSSRVCGPALEPEIGQALGRAQGAGTAAEAPDRGGALRRDSRESGEPLGELEVQLLALLRQGDLEGLHDDVVTAEELAERTGEPSSRVSAALVRLELEGWVQRRPGGAYCLGSWGAFPATVEASAASRVDHARRARAS
jgi:DNA processing protein